MLLIFRPSAASSSFPSRWVHRGSRRTWTSSTSASLTTTSLCWNRLTATAASSCPWRTAVPGTRNTPTTRSTMNFKPAWLTEDGLIKLKRFPKSPHIFFRIKNLIFQHSPPFLIIWLIKNSLCSIFWIKRVLHLPYVNPVIFPDNANQPNKLHFQNLRFAFLSLGLVWIIAHGLAAAKGI